jgi:dTMP kinase
MFITLEASEGAGKTTQARLLVAALKDAGYDVLHTREPGGSQLAEEIRALVVQGDPGRMDVETEALLFTAARRDHIRTTIRPALSRGQIVVCDRYVGSTYALQGAAGLSDEIITSLFGQFCGLRPDLTLFLDLDIEVSMSRGLARLSSVASAEGRFEAKGFDFHRQVDARFRKLLAEDERWVRVDADQGIDAVHQAVWDVVSTHPAFPILNQKSA